LPNAEARDAVEGPDRVPPRWLGQRVSGYLVAGTSREHRFGHDHVVYGEDLRVPLAMTLLDHPAPHQAHPPGLREAFEAEVPRLSAIRHAAIARILEVGRHGDHHWIVRERVAEGDLLSSVLASCSLQGRPVGANDLLHITQQLLQALGLIHRAGWLHEDVRPDQVLVRWASHGPGVHVELLGLGTRKLAQSQGVPASRLEEPHYAAPEQLSGHGIGPAADLYGLSAILFGAVTGRPPFEAANALAVMVHKLNPAHDPFGPLDEVEAPDAVKRFFEEALEADPAARFGSAEALWGGLQVAWPGLAGLWAQRASAGA
jgi:serine/threonine-protein kinase